MHAVQFRQSPNRIGPPFIKEGFPSSRGRFVGCQKWNCTVVPDTGTDRLRLSLRALPRFREYLLEHARHLLPTCQNRRVR